MSEWTVERLDELPQGTVIEWADAGYMAFRCDKGDV